MDLPLPSRRCKEFVNRLRYSRLPTKNDLFGIHWTELPIRKSANAVRDRAGTTSTSPKMCESVHLSPKLMSLYTEVALERLERGQSRPGCPGSQELIPVVVMDGERGSYAVEWVLMLHLTHRHCTIGLSLRFDAECYESWTASALFLDRTAVVNQHFLVGLDEDCCGHLCDFALNSLSFDSDVSEAARLNDARQVHEMLNEYKRGLRELTERDSDEAYLVRCRKIEALKVEKQRMTQQLQMLRVQHHQMHTQQKRIRETPPMVDPRSPNMNMRVLETCPTGNIDAELEACASQQAREEWMNSEHSDRIPRQMLGWPQSFAY